MWKKSKETEDVEESRRDSNFTAEQNYSKSFSVGGGQKFVNLSIADIKLKGKEQYKKQPYCIICFRNFTAIFRQHHCRVCANAVCKDCSQSNINKERACDLCILQYSNPAQQKKKKLMLQTLQKLCAFLIYRRNKKMEEFQKLKAGASDGVDLQREIKEQQRQIKELQQQNQKLKKEQNELSTDLESVREDNAKIESTIGQIQNELGTGQSFN